MCCFDFYNLSQCYCLNDINAHLYMILTGGSTHCEFNKVPTSLRFDNTGIPTEDEHLQ
jgi:hypothetical protein